MEWVHKGSEWHIRSLGRCINSTKVIWNGCTRVPNGTWGAWKGCLRGTWGHGMGVEGHVRSAAWAHKGNKTGTKMLRGVQKRHGRAHKGCRRARNLINMHITNKSANIFDIFLNFIVHLILKFVGRKPATCLRPIDWIWAKWSPGCTSGSWYQLLGDIWSSLKARKKQSKAPLSSEPSCWFCR